MPSDAFSRFLQTDLTREAWLSFTEQADLKRLRLTCHQFADLVAPTLFRHLDIVFNTNTFSRHSRMLALERIGHHTKLLNVTFVQDSTTFLPPLVAPETLEELTFVYKPQVRTSRPVSASSSASSSSSISSRYSSAEIDDLLVRHYPPIFHASTNIPAFSRALSALPNLRDIGIACEGQDYPQLYRKDAVDFALISLRVAIEQVNPAKLETLRLHAVHPGAIFALRPLGSYGCSPVSTRVWRRIKKLQISMKYLDYHRDLPADHLKALHTYLQSFTGLHNFDFTWLGEKGPCPLSLDAEPCTSRPSSFYGSKACPETSVSPSCKPIRFRKLRKMHLRNATFDASQAAAFVALHRKSLYEFNFDGCTLRSGTWEDALAPLNNLEKSHPPKSTMEEVIEVPIMLTTPAAKMEVECILTTMWTEEHVRNRGFEAIRRLGHKTREMVPSHVKQLLKNVRLLGWQR